MNIERGLLVIPILNFLPMLCIFGKKKKKEEIKYFIRATKKGSWRYNEAKRKSKERSIIFYRPIDKGKHWNGVWGHV